MDDLQRAACQEGKSLWGNSGPQNAGCYNSSPYGVPFFEEGLESFLSGYGQFFLVSILVFFFGFSFDLWLTESMRWGERERESKCNCMKLI